MNMETNIGMLDRIQLFDELKNLKSQYLTTLDETNIQLFVSEAKRIVDNAFDDFILAQEQIYTKDSLRAITDKAQLLSFTDIRTGYRRQMRDWVEAHPIEVQKQDVPVEELESQIPLQDRAAFRRSVSALGIGTVGVIGLRILTGSNWAYWGELAVLAAAGHQYHVGKQKDDQRLAELRQQQIAHYRYKVVNAIQSDLEAWLDAAEQENINVLKTFNINPI